MITYALLLGMIAVASIGAMAGMGTSLSDVFGSADSRLDLATGAPCTTAWGATVLHRSTVDGYSAATPQLPGSCADLAVTSTCVDGTLDPAVASASCGCPSGSMGESDGKCHAVSAAGEIDGFQVPALRHGQTVTVSKTVPIAGGSQSWQVSFTGHDGQALEQGEPQLVSVACDADYVQAGDLCVARQQVLDCTGAVPPHATAVGSTFTQLWTGSGYDPATVAYRWAEAPAAECEWGCDSGYAVDTATSGSCVPAVLTGSCTGTLPANTVAGGEASYARSWTGTGYDLPEEIAYSYGGSTCGYACAEGNIRVEDRCEPPVYTAAYGPWSGADALDACAGAQDQTRELATCSDQNGIVLAERCQPFDTQRTVRSVAGSQPCLAEAQPAHSSGGTQACGAGSATRAACTAFACEQGYTATSSSCDPNPCAAQALQGYDVAALASGAVADVAKIVAISGGRNGYTARASCSLGALAISQEAIATTTCDSGYSQQGNACVPSACTAATVSGYAVAALAHGANAAVSKVVVIANGSQTYNATASCAYGSTSVGGESAGTVSCNSGYSASGNACAANGCAAGSSGGYTYAAMSSGGSQSVSRSAGITGGSNTYTATASCSLGTVSLTGESISATSCNTGYTKSGNACAPNGCAAGSSGGYSYSAMSSGGSQSVTRSASITGGSNTYTATASCSLGTVSVSGESISNTSCTTGYTQSGTSCAPNGCAAGTSGGYSYSAMSSGGSQSVSRSAGITGGSNTYTATASCSLGTVSLTGESISATSCNSGYTKSGNNCTPSSCGAQTVNGYSVGALAHGGSTGVSKSVGISNGTQSYSATASCSLGSVSISGESAGGVSCNGGYYASGSSCLAYTYSWSTGSFGSCSGGSASPSYGNWSGCSGGSGSWGYSGWGTCSGGSAGVSYGNWGGCSGGSGSWSYGGWSGCSASSVCSGTGTQTRTASCSFNANSGTQSRSASCYYNTNSGSQSRTATCNKTAGSGTQSRSASCSYDAGSGSQSRAVTCLRNDGTAVADSYCTAAKPATSQSCTPSGTPSSCGAVTSQSCTPTSDSVCGTAGATSQSCTPSGTPSSCGAVTSQSCTPSDSAVCGGATTSQSCSSPSGSQACAIANGSGTQSCSAGSTSWSGCTVTSCNSGYTQSGNSCVSANPCSNGPFTYTGCSCSGTRNYMCESNTSYTNQGSYCQVNRTNCVCAGGGVQCP